MKKKTNTEANQWDHIDINDPDFDPTIKPEGNGHTREGVKKQKVTIKQDVDGHTIFYGETRIFKMAWDSYDKAKKWAEEADYEVIGGIEPAIQDKGNGHTPGEIGINCPIDDDGNDIIKTNPEYGNQEYFVFKIKNSFDVVGFFYPHSKQSHETMKANAARIVECWNNYDQLKADNKAKDETIRELLEVLKEITDMALKWSVKGLTPTIFRAQKAIAKHSK